MKTLVKGKTPKVDTKWSIVATCTGDDDEGCNAVHKVFVSDLFCIYPYQHNDYHYIIFSCPCCGVRTVVSSELVPEKYYSRIETDKRSNR